MLWIAAITALVCIAGTYAVLNRRNRRLHAQLTAIEQVRRDFVANVSHELRTPLTIIGGSAETLVNDTDMPAETRRRFAAAILAHTQRMQRIVDDLLDLSRIESGGWIPRPAVIDVREVANDTIVESSSAAEERGLALAVDVEPASPHVYADRTALRQVLGNLVDNAIRHTASGTVRIFATRDPVRGGTWIGVRDTGAGIAPEHLPRIFERFYRADAGRARGTGGTGLGLAIVKHLVEAHSGTVRAESTLGRGTTVSTYFPPPPRGES